MPSSSTDAGTMTPTIPATDDSGALTGSATGTGCGTDPTTGVTLCTGTSDCPSLVVDQTVFPECGFYFTGGSIFLACLCSNDLCPIGLAATCDQAASVLNSSNEGTVCGEASDNACTVITTAGANTSTSTGTTTSEAGSASGCDPDCESSCAGEPDCIQLCGC
jgi:hypothetical protein